MSHTSPGFFVLRAPLYPFDAFLAWTGTGTAHDDHSLDAARVRLTTSLAEIMARPEIREAVFLASPSLESEIDGWTTHADRKHGAKIGYALLRYFGRLTGRATPFGLFAGYCMGTVGPTTSLTLEPVARAQRHTRLDHLYITRIADEVLERFEALRRRVTCWKGSSVYELGGRVRFAERQTTTSGGVNYTLSSIAATDYLRATLERAIGGAIGSDLVQALVAALPDVGVDEAAAYIDQLLLGRVLETELSVPITGRDPLEFLIEQLRSHPETADIAHVLERANEGLAAVDRNGIGQDPAVYRAIATQLATLPHDLDLARLFQVDLVKPGRAVTLGRKVIDELQRGVDALVKLSTPRLPRALRQFISDFETRFGDREVPLLEALDAESGVPFGKVADDPGLDPSPLLQGFGFPKRGAAMEWQPRDVFMLQKLIGAVQAHAAELVLTDGDIAALTRNESTPLPDSVAVLASIAAASSEAVDQGDYRALLQMTVGPTALRLMARFAHCDPILAEQLKRVADAEAAAQGDAIVAEIVHVPEGRVGNIVARPLLRAYEIPYLGRSGAPVDRQIPLEDLVVSVVGGQVRLRSKRLGRDVLPRNSTAFKYTSPANVAVYSFLSSIQQPRTIEGAGWAWGPLYDSPYLPRVRYRSCVLYRAQWYLDGRDLKRLAALPGGERYRQFQRWRADRRLPRWITVEEGDSSLPVDLDNVLCVDMLIDYCKARSRVRALELYPSPDELCVTSPEGRFVHELIIPLVREAPAAARSRPISPAAGQLARSHPPGAEWAYAKLYASPSLCDELLVTVIAPLLERAEADGMIDGWFFIRYADPDFHLRVRFHGADPAKRVVVERQLEQQARECMSRGLCWRVQWDTYEQEIERYGGERGIVLCERVFHADSAAVAAILDTLSGDEGAEARWRLTLVGIDRLLDDLQLDLDAKLELMEATSLGFAREHDVTSARKVEIDSRFRDERARLEALLVRRPGEDHDLAPGFESFAARGNLVAPAIAELRALEAAGQLSVPWRELAQSIVHMHVNRMTRSSPRAHELLLYSFLYRLYRSQRARQRAGKSC